MACLRTVEIFSSIQFEENLFKNSIESPVLTDHGKVDLYWIKAVLHTLIADECAFITHTVEINHN